MHFTPQVRDKGTVLHADTPSMDASHGIGTNEDPPLGVILLGERSQCHRMGHPANPGTFPFPIITEHVVLPSTSNDTIYCPEVVNTVVEAAKKLIYRGAVALITSNGQLAGLQREIANRCNVPIATSSLLQIPMLMACLKASAQVGVLAVDERKLTEYHLIAINADPHLPIIGMPRHGAWQTVESDEVWNTDEDLEKELIGAAKKILEQFENVEALVLEDPRMTPYAAEIKESMLVPVFTIVDVGKWLYWANRKIDAFKDF